MQSSASLWLFVASERGGWNVLRDAISGLEADLGRAHQVLADPDHGRPLLSINAPGEGIGVSVRLDRHDWNSRMVRGIIDTFEGVVTGIDVELFQAVDWSTLLKPSAGHLVLNLDGQRSTTPRSKVLATWGNSAP